MSFIHPTSEVQTKNIGDNICIWQFCVILANAKIGNDCKIGCNVFIENNVTIGKNVVIGAGSVVTKSVKDNCVIAGNPAKKIKELG